MKSFEWSDPGTIDGAVAQLDPKGGDGVAVPRRIALKAGGVDLMDLMKEHLWSPDRVVNLRNIPGLNAVEDDGKGGVKIGSLVTLAQLSIHPMIQQKYPMLAQAAGHAATPQIRNMATLGGNLLQRPRCWYFRSDEFHCKRKGGETCYAQDGENQYHAIFNNSDCAIVHPSATATPLVALRGKILAHSQAGDREIPAEEFFIGPEKDAHRENILKPDEMIIGITLPRLDENTRQAYVRQGEKESFDWPIAEVAAVLTMQGNICQKASIVLGAAAPTPWRAREAEAVLQGKEITEDTARTAAQAALKSATPLEKNQYKPQVFATLIRRMIMQAATGKGATA